MRVLKDVSEFEVTEERRKIWSKELEIFKFFDDFCRQEGLKYYIDGGTLLGAVRHQGYIPWDDDLDVMMFYDDYCKFIELTSEGENKLDLEKREYFLQSFKTEKYYGPWHIKIRDDKTTGATPYEQKIGVGWHRGIFFDIFPLFYLPRNIIVRKIQWILLKIFRKSIEYEEWLHWPISEKKNNAKDKILTIFMRVFERIIPYKRLCSGFLKICNWQKKPTKYISHISFDLYNKEKFAYKTEWFKDSVYLDFENMKVPAPCKYKEYLKYRYGDYNKLVVGDSIHTNVLFNTEVSYKEILNKEY